MSNIKNYLRGIFAYNGEERRREKRYPTRLVVGITLPDAEPQSHTGYTCNVSESGLALILTGISKDDAAKLSANGKLLILLALPAKSIKIQAAGLYCKVFNEQALELGFFLGVSITGMSDDDRNVYLEYMKELAAE